jgi:hypothetical protein
MYKKVYDLFTKTDSTKFIRYLPIPTDIPMSLDNTDYQAYLKWVAEGNTPLPAENA